MKQIAASVYDHSIARDTIRQALQYLAEHGWQLQSVVQQIWAGERDRATLTADLDPHDAQLVQRLLDLIERQGA